MSERDDKAIKFQGDEYIDCLTFKNKDTGEDLQINLGEKLYREAAYDRLAAELAEARGFTEKYKGWFEKEMDLRHRDVEELEQALAAAERERDHYKKRWLDVKSERDNLRVQYEAERERAEIAEGQNLSNCRQKLIAEQERDQARAEVERLKAENKELANRFPELLQKTALAQQHVNAELLDAQAERDRYKAALERLAVCGGGCEGPLGCMCKAPIAREALEGK